MYSNRISNVYTSLGAKFNRGRDLSKKEGKKDSQLILRLDKAERDAFVDLCKEMDTSAAREIRAFIRKFIKKNRKG